MASFNQRYDNFVKQRSDLSFKGKVSDIPATMNYKKDEKQSATRGIVEQTLLSKVFFSNANMQIIQNAIRAEVYRLTDNTYVIGEQSESQLEIVMRSIYLQFSYPGVDDITAEVKRLNGVVVKDVVPGVISEVLQYDGYLKDIKVRNKVMDLPKDSNIKGTKQMRPIDNVLNTGSLNNF